MKTRPAVLPMRMSFSSLSSSRKGLPTSRQFIGMSNLRDQSFSYSNRQASCPASLIEGEMTGSTWSFHKIASGWSTSEKNNYPSFPAIGFFRYICHPELYDTQYLPKPLPSLLCNADRVKDRCLSFSLFAIVPKFPS